MKSEHVESLISFTLRTGVFLSITVVFLGLVFTFVHHPAYVSSRIELGALINPHEEFTNSFSGVIRGVMAQQGKAIVMLGILLLIATPVVRVAISVILFAVQRDRIFVVITATVFVVLLVSLFTGMGG